MRLLHVHVFLMVDSEVSGRVSEIDKVRSM